MAVRSCSPSATRSPSGCPHISRLEQLRAGGPASASTPSRAGYPHQGGADPTTGLGAVTSMRQRFGDTESCIVGPDHDAGFSVWRGHATHPRNARCDRSGHREQLWVNVHLPRTPGVQQAWEHRVERGGGGAAGPAVRARLGLDRRPPDRNHGLRRRSPHGGPYAGPWRPPSPPCSEALQVGAKKVASPASRGPARASERRVAQRGIRADGARPAPRHERPSPSPPVRSCLSTCRDGFRSARWPPR